MALDPVGGGGAVWEGEETRVGARVGAEVVVAATGLWAGKWAGKAR